MSEPVSAFASVLASFLGLAFAAEAMGLFGHSLNSLLAAMFLFVGACLDPGARRRWNAPLSSALFSYACCTIGLVMAAADPSIRFFGLALWFLGLSRVNELKGAHSVRWIACGVGCVLIGVFRFATTSSLLGWYALQSVSTFLSEWTTRSTGKPISLGPTFHGLVIAFAALAICLCGLAASNPRRIGRFVAGLLLVAVGYAGYLTLFALLPHWFSKPSVAFDVPAAASESMSLWDFTRFWEAIGRFVWAIFPLHFPILLPCLMGAAVGWYLKGILRRPNTERTEATVPVFVPAFTALACVLAVWALTNAPARSADSPREVAFFKEGFHNWMVPSHERYGSRSSGMFGNLPLLIERMGWRAEVIPTISKESLNGKNILGIMNQKDPLPKESIEAIDRFVLEGGSLLILGDHTFWKGGPNEQPDPTRLLLNEPLGTTNILYNFDSADYFIGGWLHSMQYQPHQMTAILEDASNESGCVVGASLAIKYPAAPLIIGRFGFSDPGVITAVDRGYMGNLDPDPGEPLGDLVLVAAQNVGKGRVVVVGDTSGFVNAIQTQTWPFITRVFHWLGGEGQAAIPQWRDALGLGLLTLIVLLLLPTLCHNLTPVWVAAVAMTIAGWSSRLLLKSLSEPPPLRGKVAMVDLSHVGRHSLEGWRDTAINGIYLNLMREGYFAFGAPRFDRAQLREAELFVTVAPTKSYSSSELRALKEFMERGGTVLLAVGWEDRDGSLSLLRTVDLDVLHRPQGRAPGEVPGATVQPMYWRAWPVTGGEPLALLRGEPIIVRKAVGRGQIVLIGDSQFLLNKNLEVEDGAILMNVQFFRWLLGRIMNPASP